MQNKPKKLPKSDESRRFVQLKSEKSLTWEQISIELAIPLRTLQHYCFNTGEFSGAVLRAINAVYGISLDWFVNGLGTMYVATRPGVNEPAEPYLDGDDDPYLADDLADAPLFPWREFIDDQNAQDYFYLWAATIEQSLLESGAQPGIDYSRLDLFKLAQPFVLARHQAEKLDVLIYKPGGN